jgi:type IX secretion system PorP/SprF family membrane protein
MRKTFIFILLTCAWPLIFHAQQQPQFDLYMYNQPAWNPAAAGVGGAISATAFGRSQWIGMQGLDSVTVNPRTFGLTLDMPLYRIKSGAGLTVQYDRLGFEKNLDIRLHYAYHHVFSNNHMLSGGISLALQNHTIDYSSLKPAGEDPALPAIGKDSDLITDLDFGVHYKIPRKFYAAFAVSGLLGSTGDIGGVDYKLARHYYLAAGYDFRVIDRKRRVPWQVTPGFLLKASGGSVQLDLNAIVTYNDLIWGGVLFRVERAAGLMAGVKYYGLTAGVAWDYTLNNIVSGKSRNSLEFFVTYSYPIYPGVIKRSAYNTRNL